MPPRRRKQPLLQHYQVEIRGNQYWVIHTTKGRALSAGPFKTREAAQKRADELEKRVHHG